ncbi:hypothetical protein BO70DRAFT_291865 [Aspergillus heteromorphus CBS 117.55]|uniref:Zn(2)-C6 fungal-type domain-containing protein n=1 Tax=Aspergillus heteromorphus CBS 117.55 TaxID=1448321 RepID=A0A317W9X0_9EURO|nr:uncharacterized protein BO70DRAFT_291865 [Aspergillus heteromorphus CBS 117.55]PWY82107.1 hypothetical protein BO70DRAFT_291865 [Aspergillus heteromorphus CBS 117.55]
MTSLPLTPGPEAPKHRLACSLCARRKVKCDKGDPCSNCLKARAECLYDSAAIHRPRKRAADEELLARLARYEDLMRQHNVDFTPYANSWVHSGLEGPIKENPESPQLKYPSLRHKDDPFLHPTPSLESICSTPQPPLDSLHPEPRHIYRFWQIFVQSVNPLTKIIHVPTLQQRILDASWDPTNTPAPLTAMLFAIYTHAVTALSPTSCSTSFQSSRATLLTRYRTATLRALIAADFLTTRTLEVLQAFVLFLLSNPECELTSTLTGSAIRVAQKLGLDRTTHDPKLSIFENEMRVRLWAQLRGLDFRCRAVYTPAMKPPPVSSLGDFRLPRNVNDADLHPDMQEPPIEHTGPTEMLCVLMKLEVTLWRKSSPTATKVFESILEGPHRSKAPTSTDLEDAAIRELEAIYQEKYFRCTDERIPLHAVTRAMTRLAIARLRFTARHPRGRAAGMMGADLYVTREENDMLFESALTWLEMVDVLKRSEFSFHLLAHLTSRASVDAYICVLSDLRRRCMGARVDLAWRLVEELFTEHVELVEDVENSFFVALGDLTVEAWEARRKALEGEGEGLGEGGVVTPWFVQSLWERRHSVGGSGGQVSVPVPGSVPGSAPGAGSPLEVHGFGVIDDQELNWEYWNDFLRL